MRDGEGDSRQRRRPSEFRYWERRDRWYVQALRRAGQLALGFDPQPADELVDTFASMYYDADPIAEAFVDEVYLERGAQEGRALLEAAIDGGVASIADPPPSLVRLFEDIDTDPPWVDHELVEIGARTFRRYGTAVFYFAGSVTLEAYSESSVAKPLALTGAYSGDSARHRFLETAAFWIAVSEPGALARGCGGRASALRVRIMHVFVRRRLLDHPEWDIDAWGVPISQADALLTLMGGSLAPGLAMQAMGFRPTRREIEAMMHFWRYVGHLMGVRPRWYPASIREAFYLVYITLLKAAHQAGDDGRQLCLSYVRAFSPDSPGSASGRVRAWLSDGIHRGYARFFVPPWTYRRNRLPRAGLWALHPLVQFPFLFAAETARRRVSRLDDVADWVARQQRRRWFRRHMGKRPLEYQPAASFTR